MNDLIPHSKTLSLASVNVTQLRFETKSLFILIILVLFKYFFETFEKECFQSFTSYRFRRKSRFSLKCKKKQSCHPFLLLLILNSQDFIFKFFQTNFFHQSFKQIAITTQPTNANHAILFQQNVKNIFCTFTGNNHLLEIRLLKTGFLSRFQPNP